MTARKIDTGTDELLCSVENHIATITLNRPERRNALSDILTPAFRQALLDCSWPGNVRQLKNVIEHAVIMSTDDELSAQDLPDEILATRWTRQPKALSPEVIRATLNRTHNNRSKAAELLGVGRTTLWRSMKRYGIE